MILIPEMYFIRLELTESADKISKRIMIFCRDILVVTNSALTSNKWIKGM